MASALNKIYIYLFTFLHICILLYYIILYSITYIFIYFLGRSITFLIDLPKIVQLLVSG